MPQAFALARPLFALTLGSALLLSCSKNPESTGKKIAALACDCAEQKDNLAYQHQQQLLQSMESGEYQTQAEAYAQEALMRKKAQLADSACMAQPTALVKQAEADFAKAEDRAALTAATRTSYLQGIMELKDKNKDRKNLDGAVSATIAKLRPK